LFLAQLIYKFYERRLESFVRRAELPRHVGIVLDGNRRFARRQGFDDVGAGHRAGADKAEELVAWCDELGIPFITAWVLSVDNFKRPPEELESIFAIVEERVAALGDSQERSSLRRIRAVGRLELLPQSTREAIARVEAETAGNAPYELLIAIGYGGREEITDAVRRMIADHLRRGESLEGIASGLEPDEIGRYLYAPDVPDPDLIIRTSGELRFSGFLLWQSAYSEYYFCDVFWPDFRKIDFLRAIRSYAQRQRRRGA
jgi:short-chain Z-isoprenyl diphosphate synthase